MVLDFENQGYVLDKLLPMALPEGSSPEERVTLQTWLEDKWNINRIILSSITNDIQKQYDRLDDIALIMLRMKDIYVILDRHTRLLLQKHSSGPSWPRGPLYKVSGSKYYP
ncbi:UNVERIFIED_CONTAM: hypothetical protein Sradi_3184200 [Sesamum radiatum]|uniref:Uncharacterized protein n=1 Tax=Sesamum radiatum TaxID=300843 RepID=A0AAW2RF02_SESRA